MDTDIIAKFLGGVADGQNLTGSCILLTVRQEKKTTRILIDAGLIQSGANFLERNRALLDQLNPGILDAIILTHSHIDHIGRLPMLVKHGFSGRIYCTKATSRLLGVMLEDSAKIQAMEIDYLRSKAAKYNLNNFAKTANLSRSQLALGNYDKKRRKKSSKKHPSSTRIEALYTLADIGKTCSLVKNEGFEYRTEIKLAKNISLKFYSSGHVLGGAICVIKIETKTKNIYLGFSGDLGRQDGIILPPPEIVDEKIDYWFIESTYGDKIHPERTDEIVRLLATVRTAVTEKQKIIIPSFALERTQEIIYLLSYYIKIGEIPYIALCLDSPLAGKITDIFAENWRGGMFLGQEKLGFNPFDPKENKSLRIINKPEDSEALIATSGPYLVVAGSGMCDAGRVREHLRVGLGQKNLVVCLVGYMAENSLGRKLKNGLPIIRMNGEEIIVKARIISFASFSAHADYPYLVSYTLSVIAKNPDDTKKIFVIHGEEMSAALLKLALIETINNKKQKIVIPKMREEYILI